ncbi:hypothetical protein Taro_040393, partial [Colocasia esculenta]|nr:hypothetical protein [Colocasia esculenta]
RLLFNKILVGAVGGLLLLQCRVCGECGLWLARAGVVVDDEVAGRGLPYVEDSCRQVRCGALGRHRLHFRFPELFLACSGGRFSQNFFVLISVLLPSRLRVSPKIVPYSLLVANGALIGRSGGGFSQDCLALLLLAVVFSLKVFGNVVCAMAMRLAVLLVEVLVLCFGPLFCMRKRLVVSSSSAFCGCSGWWCSTVALWHCGASVWPSLPVVVLRASMFVVLFEASGLPCAFSSWWVPVYEVLGVLSCSASGMRMVACSLWPYHTTSGLLTRLVSTARSFDDFNHVVFG